MSVARRVVKLGGSLLDEPHLADRLREWLKRQSPAATAIIVGGGAMADCVRAADRVHRLSSEAAHWLAIGAMSLTAELVASLLPEARKTISLAEFREAAVGDVLIFDVQPLLVEEHLRVVDTPLLPIGWHVTSDSIAAHFACVTAAVELVLLKSGLPEAYLDWPQLALAGYVDDYFPEAVGRLPVRLVNFRSREFAELSIKAKGN